MPKLFDRTVFFDAVRDSLFNGSMTEQQVDGMGYKLTVWEDHHHDADLRWLAYAFATSMWETAGTMWPIEEYGKGAGYSYGEKDDETGQTYYGRGDVQLTWRENYCRATSELQLTGDNDLEWNAQRALDPAISADVMFLGMMKGWFRPPNDLPMFFNDDRDDAYQAREIINGDKTKEPDYAGGMDIGTIIADYHKRFLSALRDAAQALEEEKPSWQRPVIPPRPERGERPERPWRDREPRPLPPRPRVPRPTPRPPAELTEAKAVNITIRIRISADAPVQVNVITEAED